MSNLDKLIYDGHSKLNVMKIFLVAKSHFYFTKFPSMVPINSLFCNCKDLNLWIAIQISIIKSLNINLTQK